MALLVELEPRPDPNERLMDGVLERPRIRLRSDDAVPTLTVGRGSVTGIADLNIEEEVLHLSFSDSSLENQSVIATLLADPEQCSVHVNGIAWEGMQKVFHLGSGDTISLDGLRYEYLVHTQPCSSSFAESKVGTVNSIEEECKPMNSASDTAPTMQSTPSASPTIALPQNLAGRLSEEIQCSVCLEIQVRPRTLNPCGHSFCDSCVETLKNCPQCRKPIQSHVPAHQLDNLITALVSVPNLLDSDDVEQFQKRRRESRVNHSASPSRRPLKRHRDYRHRDPRPPRIIRAEGASTPPRFHSHLLHWSNGTAGEPSYSNHSGGNYMLHLPPPSAANAPDRQPGSVSSLTPQPFNGGHNTTTANLGTSAEEAICID